MTDPKGSIRRDGAFIEIRVPIDEVFSLRMALQPCPCKAPKSVGRQDLRARIDQALARAMFRGDYSQSGWK